MTTRFNRAAIDRRVWACAASASLLGLLAVWWYPKSGQSQEVARSAAAESVHALARLEPEAGLLTIGVRPGARLESVAVREGDQVEKGVTLALVEGHAAALKQLALTEAQRKSARYKRSLLREKATVERDQHDKSKEVKLSSARHLSKLAEAQLDEIKALAKSLGASQVRDKLDLGKAQFEADMRKSQADASLSELEVADSLLARLRALEDKELADGTPDDELLDRQVESAQAAVEQTIIRAPSDGRILSVLAREGQVSAGTIAYMGDLSSIVGKAEVDQAEIARIGKGDPAEVVVRGKAIAGRVTHVSGMVLPNQMRDIDPRARQDLRVVLVTIQLDEASEASRYINMQVEAMIRPRPEGMK